MMVKIQAMLTLYSGEKKRQAAFESGYRPLFNVLTEGLTSGKITLLDRSAFQPGEEGMVEVTFLSANCQKGTKFYFYEGEEPLGEGVVLEILEVRE